MSGAITIIIILVHWSWHPGTPLAPRNPGSMQPPLCAHEAVGSCSRGLFSRPLPRLTVVPPLGALKMPGLHSMRHKWKRPVVFHQSHQAELEGPREAELSPLARITQDLIKHIPPAFCLHPFALCLDTAWGAQARGQTLSFPLQPLPQVPALYTAPPPLPPPPQVNGCPRGIQCRLEGCRDVAQPWAFTQNLHALPAFIFSPQEPEQLDTRLHTVCVKL